MICFYPGPAKVYPQVKQYMIDAYQKGILSIQHRSDDFMQIVKRIYTLFREKFGLPEDYTLFFLSSNTECWELVGQSFAHWESWHIYNGTFGEKWFEGRKKLSEKSSLHFPFGVNEIFDIGLLPISFSPTLLCITQNETSNGTQQPSFWLKNLRKTYPDTIIAVDAASSMGGTLFDWRDADIWFAGVQKCFGLPAGLAVMLCSPQAVEKATSNLHYNSITNLHKNMQIFQPTHTPNVLNIYLLMCILEHMEMLYSTSEITQKRAIQWYDFLDGLGIDILVRKKEVRSDTVICIKAEKEKIDYIKKIASSKGISLGNGYGIWKEDTFRIANFPAITDAEIAALKFFLQAHWK